MNIFQVKRNCAYALYQEEPKFFSTLAKANVYMRKENILIAQRLLIAVEAGVYPNSVMTDFYYVCIIKTHKPK